MEKHEDRLSGLIEEKMARLHDLEVSVDAKLHEFHLVSQSVERVKDELKSVSRDINNLEQYSRRNNVRIFGIRESPNESTDKIVCDLAETIGVNINVSDIDRSHRVGRKGDGDQQAVNATAYQQAGGLSYSDATRKKDSRSRAIIVKFTSHKFKYALMKNRRKLKGSGMVIVEDLTKHNMDLLSAASKMKEKVAATWSIDGRIIALLKSTGKKRAITSLTDLNT